jgi:hypothetical protein
VQRLARLVELKRQLAAEAEATGNSEITDCSIGQSVHVAMMMTNSLTPHKEISQSGRLKPLRSSALLGWLLILTWSSYAKEPPKFDDKTSKFQIISKKKERLKQ